MNDRPASQNDRIETPLDFYAQFALYIRQNKGSHATEYPFS
jgi:hypothetical protein